jgi:hypothetical protein
MQGLGVDEGPASVHRPDPNVLLKGTYLGVMYI